VDRRSGWCSGRLGPPPWSGQRRLPSGVRGPAFAWITHFMMMAWTSAVLEVVQPLLRSRWFHVRDREPLVYRRLGVLQYGALLRRVGWERATSSGRSFDGTRSSLPDLERRTRTSEFAHVVLGAVGAGMVVVGLACHAWDAAAWLFAANVVLHAYPIMLQRVLRARLHRLRQPAN
jgi:Glycosyl-4,4'-diaponeurosporenoate acyltransferase